MLRGMATWQEKNGVITFKWGSDWDQAAPNQRLGLVRSFADSDACLTGSAREINFYRLGKLVANASPTSGIRLVDNTPASSKPTGKAPLKASNGGAESIQNRMERCNHEATDKRLHGDDRRQYMASCLRQSQ